jgi:hypothetical protein
MSSSKIVWFLPNRNSKENAVFIWFLIPTNMFLCSSIYLPSFNLWRTKYLQLLITTILVFNLFLAFYFNKALIKTVLIW